MRKFGCEPIDRGDDLVATGYGERAARAEINLHIDDDKGLVIVPFHGLPRSRRMISGGPDIWLHRLAMIAAGVAVSLSDIGRVLDVVESEIL